MSLSELLTRKFLASRHFWLHFEVSLLKSHFFLIRLSMRSNIKLTRVLSRQVLSDLVDGTKRELAISSFVNKMSINLNPYTYSSLAGMRFKIYFFSTVTLYLLIFYMQNLFSLVVFKAFSIMLSSLSTFLDNCTMRSYTNKS